MIVAVVEDSDDMATLVVALLGPRHETVVFSDGASACAYDGWGTIDVALVDLMMPGVSGVEVLIWLRREWPQVRLVIVTALDPTPEVAALADAIIRKPFRADELLAAL